MNFKKITVAIVFSMIYCSQMAFSQVLSPPAPCTTGNENTCKCNLSPILCTIDSLNGYEYDMTLFQHPSDGPQPMCPPPAGTGTTSNNPTWFSFIAWCSSLSVKVNYTNCLDAPGAGTTFGIQSAVYAACPATPFNAVQCATSVSGCINNSFRQMELTNLNIGQIYYLLVDGCAGSACHIKIEIINPCSQNAPTPFVITGPSTLCKPNAAEIYSLTNNEMKIKYWYIDGVQVAQDTSTIQRVIDFSNYTPGIHTLCADGATPPCIPLNGNPPQVCRDICIAPSESNAGRILFNTPNCPNTTVPITINNYNNSPDFIERILVTNAIGEIIHIGALNSSTTTFTNPSCTNEFKVYSLNYYSLCNTAFPTPVLNMNISTIINACNNCGCDIKSRASTNTTNTYTASTTDFVNPERGWYRYTETRAANYTLLDSASLVAYRSLHQPSSANYTIYASLIQRNFYLENFKAGPISAAYLQNMQTDFNTIRKAGLKVIPRFIYTDQVNAGSCGSWICPPYGDAPKSVVLNHISQLKTLFEKNADVIATVQMGFIGTWGEQYYTDYFGDASQSPYTLSNTNWNDRRAVLDSLLKAVPQELNVQVRFPQMKQKDIYGNAALTNSLPLSISEAFLGSNKSRIGFHNDCFLANFDDYGTYNNYSNGSSDTTNLKPYMASDSKYVFVGGETCDSTSYGSCSNALYEMSRMHFSYLNADYNNRINNTWSTGNCINDIKKRLGYRLAISKASFSNNASQGSEFYYDITIDNTGFSSPINKKIVSLVIKNTSTNEEYEGVIDTDTRKWFNGSHNIIGSLCIPSCIAAGTYNVYIKISDSHSNLFNRPEYCIRLASNVWNASKGYNDLQYTFTIANGSGASCGTGQKFVSSNINTWIGANNTAWNAATSNWSLGRIPLVCDHVVIPDNITVIVPTGCLGKAQSVLVKPGGKLKINFGGYLEVEK